MQRNGFLSNLADLEFSGPSDDAEEIVHKVFKTVKASEERLEKYSPRNPHLASSYEESSLNSSSSSDGFSDIQKKNKQSTIEYAKQQESDWQRITSWIFPNEDEEMEPYEGRLSNASDDAVIVMGIGDEESIEGMEKEVPQSDEKKNKKIITAEWVQDNKENNSFNKNNKKEEWPPHENDQSSFFVTNSDPNLRVTKKIKDLRKTLSNTDRGCAGKRSNTEFNSLEQLGQRQYGFFHGISTTTDSQKNVNDAPRVNGAEEIKQKSKLSHNLFTFGRNKMHKLTQKIKSSSDEKVTPPALVDKKHNPL